MTPLQRYQRHVETGRLQPDPAQAKVVERLQRLYEDLLHDMPSGTGWRQRLLNWFRPQPRQLVKGLYLWGGVGRGKTLLVDSFYHCLPFAEKRRIHFHRFMQKVHAELRRHRNVVDPLQPVADRFARQARVLCFDEFHVEDITDAMLLGGLLKALFERGVTLVATSNTEPRRLYWDGLQRERFLPAIDLLEMHTEVVEIGGDQDYRLNFLDHAEIYHHPLDAAGDEVLAQAFEHIAPEAGEDNVSIEVDGREIRAVRHADGVAWFEFAELCDAPRGPSDYIEIARTFQTVLLANVPRLGCDDEDKAKRLITLIDELYDRRVKLIVAAAEPPSSLYCGERHAADFQRTVSRLQEMRSHSYLGLSHRP